MLRIIAGTYKGRKIEHPDLQKTRPTTDKVREAIFGAIAFEIPGAICLDLFSGSGAMAIEAVSRGAVKVVASEKDKAAWKVINNNLTILKINNIELLNTDALTLLKMKNHTVYDFIFLDPPYGAMPLLNQCIATIAIHKMLQKYGLIIVETNSPEDLDLPKGLVIQKNKKYGKTTILYVAII